MAAKKIREGLGVLLPSISLAFLTFLYGAAVVWFKIFPYGLLESAYEGFWQLSVDAGAEIPWYYQKADDPRREAVRKASGAYPGVNLITRIDSGRRFVAEIVDLEGNVLHSWELDWFELWPDPTHIPEDDRPKSKPGAWVNDAVVMDNGDLVFTLEYLGLMRVDLAGNVVWRLPYRAHHSIHLHDDGNLWVSGMVVREEYNPRFPNYAPPFQEQTVIEVSPEGDILNEWSVEDILVKNGLNGLLAMRATRGNNWRSVSASGDVLHMNDVEPYSAASMGNGFFESGDVMVSLRDANTVFVFDKETEEIKFIATGQFVLQHDPDFMDSETISVFDNNSTGFPSWGPFSRIVTLSAADQDGIEEAEVYFEGNYEQPFYTDLAGKHQWLGNGNLLVTEFATGRAFEVNREGQIVWEYVNYVGDGMVGGITDVQRLPEEYARFFSENKVTSGNKDAN